MRVPPVMTTFVNIGEQIFLRCDPKYRHFWDERRGISIEQSKHCNVRLKDILLPFTKMRVKKGDLDEERPILELNDVESRTSLILRDRVASEVGSDKLDFADCDLVLNRLEPYLGKIVINDVSKGYIGTTEWIPLKLDAHRAKPTFLKYLLLLPQFLNSFGLLTSGKRHARLSQIDLRNMTIPLPSDKLQIELANKIVPIEAKIVALHRALAKPVDVINRVFARQFGYSLAEYERRAKRNTFRRPVTDFGRSFLLRSTVKFQHPKYDYMQEILCHHPSIKLKNLCAEEIRRGVQPKYERDGDVLVVKTVNLENEFLDFSEPEYVTHEFFEANLSAAIKENDILVSSTGEGRGKVDIYNIEDTAIADSHISIVGLDQAVNHHYVLYFMRSFLGKMQLETLEIAVKGTPEIYPDQLGQLRIIALDPKKQDEIAEEVTSELQEIQKQKAEIQRLRDQIDEILIEEIMKEAK